MEIKKDHIQNIIANDTCNRIKKLDNPEGWNIYFDTYTGKHFLHEPGFMQCENREWFDLEFVASIQKRIWENWDELATPGDYYEFKLLDCNPDLSAQLVSSNGVVYYTWWSFRSEKCDSPYIPIEDPSKNTEDK